ncbi:MAG TPA: hypothetical protein VEC99_09810, partial [Clostridia bacterium]|nr:hypothetical protein [Clostridia bacterium]
HEPPEDKEWDEFDYEKFMRECDARTDKYAELLDKYIDHPDRDHIIAKEMGWTWLEEAIEDEAEIDGEPAKTQEDSQAEDAVDSFDGEAAEDSEWDDPFEEANGISPLEPDPATEGVDWVRKPDGYIGHPLALRALEGSLAFWNRLEKVGLAKINDPDLVALASEYQITGAKLAGALDSLAYGRELCEGAFIVAYLKRALSHVHGALAALEKVSPKNLLPAEAVSSLRAEFFGIRDEILQLMQEFRRLP